MALQSFKSGLFIPQIHNYDTITLQALTIDATGEAAATLFRSQFAGTVTGVTFRLGAVTTGDTISIEVQTVTTASGLPSNTLFSANAVATFNLSTVHAQTWQTVTLTSPVDVAEGADLALVVKRADVAGAGNFTVTRLSVGLTSQIVAAANVLAAWNRTIGSVCIFPVFSGTTQPAAMYQYAPATPAAVAISAGTTPDEIGNIINLPFRTRAVGFYAMVSASVTSVIKFNLYDTNGTTLMTSARMDADIVRAGAVHGLIEGYFPSATVLAVNSNYRIAAFASVGSCSIVELSAADVTAMARINLGTTCFGTSRTDAGAWSNNAQTVFSMGIIVDQLDDSAASGGAAGIAHIIGGP